MQSSNTFKAARAAEVPPGELDWLRAALAEIAHRVYMATRRLFIVPDQKPNAFATGGGNNDGDSPNPAGAMVLAIVAPMAAGLVQMVFSRSREFEADRVGADLIGEPRPLAGALARLGHVSKWVPMDVDLAHATAYIVNPLTGKQANFTKLFMTHPPMEDRITRLLGSPVGLQASR